MGEEQHPGEERPRPLKSPHDLDDVWHLDVWCNFLNRFPSSPDPSVEDRLFYLAVRTVLTASSSTAIAGGVSFWLTPARAHRVELVSRRLSRGARILAAHLIVRIVRRLSWV